METDQIIKRILSNTYVKTDVYRRVALLQAFLDSVLFADAKPSGELAAGLSEHYSASPEREDALGIAAWGEDVLESFSADHLGEEMDALKSRIDTLPTLVLYVPVLFSVSHLSEIGKWCRANIHPEVLLEVSVDVAAAGGCTFVWNHALHDFSLDYFLEKHREELLKRFDNEPADSPAAVAGTPRPAALQGSATA